MINVLPMTCSQCGAAIKQGDGRFCSHCGASLPDRPRISPEEWLTHAGRFTEAERNAQHGIAMDLPAPEASIMAGVVLPAMFLVAWIGIGGFMTSRFAQPPGPTSMALVPALMTIGGAFAIGWGIRTALRKARAPVHRSLAVLINSRTDVSTSGTSDNRRTSTSYYATLQFRDGSRLELPTTSGVAGLTSRGDIGLAVMRAGDLVDFHRYQL